MSTNDNPYYPLVTMKAINRLVPGDRVLSFEANGEPKIVTVGQTLTGGMEYHVYAEGLTPPDDAPFIMVDASKSWEKIGVLT